MPVEQCKYIERSIHAADSEIPCDRFAVRDGYCKKHHPTLRAEMRAEVAKAHKIQRAENVVRYAELALGQKLAGDDATLKAVSVLAPNEVKILRRRRAALRKLLR